MPCRPFFIPVWCTFSVGNHSPGPTPMVALQLSCARPNQSVAYPMGNPYNEVRSNVLTRTCGLMPRTKVTSKGQVTIPKDVRERLGLRPGDEIEFVEDKAGYRVEKRVTASPFQKYRSYLKDLAGRDPDKLVEEMRGE